MRTYTGTCHCGKVAFEVDTVLDGVGVCNCSICRRRNAVMHRVAAENFRLVRGAGDLVLYQFNTGTAKHYFCGTCGVYPFHRPRLAPEAYTVNVFCLEGVGDEEIAALSVNRFDGRSFSSVE
ncbi:MAG: type I-B CRISPR-associated protein Cas8b1/Cst1 [Magnetovibrio sp.]|nr:type I-B CRISPR-associated protein Cas8b1/Cst1 [Magnetovibrio sp.]